MKKIISTLLVAALMSVSVAGTVASASTSSTPDEDAGRDFFVSHLIDENGGVYCSATVGWPEEPYACSNHEFGSERQGLAMLYFAYAEDEDVFSDLVDFLEDYMLSPVGLVYWKLDEDYDHSEYMASASIDDIRIVQALLVGYERFGDERYYNLGMEIADALKEYAVNSRGYFTEGASWDDDGVYTSKKLYLSYANLGAMDLIAEYDDDWKAIKRKTARLLVRGYLGDGLFVDFYKFGTRSYSDNGVLNSIHEATIGLNLSYYRKTLARQNLRFWKERWANELMEGQYNHIASSYSDNGEPLCEWCADISVYSLVAMLAHQLGNTRFESKMIGAINQIEDGEFAGAFAWDARYQISSYSNALALIALAVQRGAGE